MFHPRVNEIFARVNERTGVNEVNEFSVVKFLHPLLLVFNPTHISDHE